MLLQLSVICTEVALTLTNLRRIIFRSSVMMRRSNQYAHRT
jgi:hypothetical protein